MLIEEMVVISLVKKFAVFGENRCVTTVFTSAHICGHIRSHTNTFFTFVSYFSEKVFILPYYLELRLKGNNFPSVFGPNCITISRLIYECYKYCPPHPLI